MELEELTHEDDFSTLRTAQDGDEAVRIVDRGEWDKYPAEFRIVDSRKALVKYGSIN
jgi:hypothetical protein